MQRTIIGTSRNCLGTKQRSLLSRKLSTETPALSSQKTAFENAKKWFEKYSKTFGNERGKVVEEWANYRNHSEFYGGILPNKSINERSNNPIADQMKRSLYTRHILPQTLSAAKELLILQDCLGQEWESASPYQLPVQVELQFDVVEARTWRGTYGQYIDPSHTIKSPRLVLYLPPAATAAEKEALYTVLLTDLDAPLLESGSYEEWCHWLVTDIAVGNDGMVELQPQLSKYIANLPESESPIPVVGNVVFDYVPMHPAISNPKKQHRYVLSVWAQPNNRPLKDKLNSAKVNWNIKAQLDKKNAANLPPHAKLCDGDGEERIEYRQRFMAFPTLKFAEVYGLTLKGLSHFTSGFSITTPAVFKQLGLHQPVYGPKIKPEMEHNVVSKLDTCREIAEKVTEMTSDLAKLENVIDRDTLKRLNHGYRQNIRPVPLATRRDLKYLKATAGSAEAAAKNAAFVQSAKQSVKRVNLTVWGAAGLARLESGFQGGAIVERIKEKRSRYENH